MHKEILRIMSVRDIDLYRSALNENILRLIPEMRPAIGFDGGPHHDETVFEHLLWVSEEISPKYPLLRFAGLLHDIGKPYTWNGQHFAHHAHKGAEIVETVMKRLGGFSERERLFVCGAVDMHMLKPLSQMNDRTIVAKLREMEKAGLSWRDFLRLRLADRHGTGNWRFRKAVSPNIPYARDMIRIMRKAIQNQEIKAKPQRHNPLAVSGKDIMRVLDIEPGPQVGKVLKFLTENYPHDDREALLAGIKDYAEKEKQFAPCP